MTDVTRKTGGELVKLALQAGIETQEDAEWALEAGARLLAWGFTETDLNRAVWDYNKRVFGK